MQQDNKRHVPDWLLERLALGELDAETAADVRRRLAAEGRSPDDVAAAVAYFASEGAEYVTGQVLSVSGGLTMAG